jgi:hypothetical protein
MRLLDRAAGDGRRVRDLTADLGDRRIQLFRRGGDGLHVARRIGRGGRDHLDLTVGLLGRRRHAVGGLPHLARRTAERFERLAHLRLERRDVLFDRLLARRGLGVAIGLLAFDTRLVGGVLLERAQRAGERNDLVRAEGVAGGIGDGEHTASLAQALPGRPDIDGDDSDDDQAGEPDDRLQKSGDRDLRQHKSPHRTAPTTAVSK